MQQSQRTVNYFADKYKKVRTQSEVLCKPLKAEDYVVQPIVDVSPPKWHLGHTTWFFEKLLLEHFAKQYKPFDPSFNYVFNSYYESIGKRVLRTNRGNLTRPTIDEVLQYRAYVDHHLLEYIDAKEEISKEEALLLETGLQHEQQHQELLLYDIKYILGTNPLFPAYKKRETSPGLFDACSLNFIGIEAGNYTIGHQGEGFAFDNETGSHQVYLHQFEIADRLVSNSEYMEFMEAGGYDNFQPWYSEAWDWVKQENRRAPLHWHQIEGEWHVYTLAGLEKINPNEPVSHISHYEAAAYAQWKGLRLPTEFEWEVACKQLSPEIASSANFVEKGMLRPAAALEGNKQFYGDLWEWTASAYLPYPYFKTPDGALAEYNGKFMINQMVLRGGSYATPVDHIRPTYRNFFHPHLSWNFTGIRLAKHV